jgi:hypothetical protein
MEANKRNKSARFECVRREGIPDPFDKEQFLILRVAHRQNHPATIRKLRTKRFGHGRRCCGNKYCVKRSKFGQA